MNGHPSISLGRTILTWPRPSLGHAQARGWEGGTLRAVHTSVLKRIQEGIGLFGSHCPHILTQRTHCPHTLTQSTHCPHTLTQSTHCDHTLTQRTHCDHTHWHSALSVHTLTQRSHCPHIDTALTVPTLTQHSLSTHTDTVITASKTHLRSA